MTGRSIYVAGPMRGRPLFNFPAFDAAAGRLRAKGWTVYNPAEHDREMGFNETRSEYEANGWQDPAVVPGVFSYRTAFRWDLNAIMDGDAIYLLRGWEQSTGGRIELAVAQFVGCEVLLEDGAVAP